MKQIHCFEIASKTRALEATFIEFHTMPGLREDKFWREPANSPDHMVRVERLLAEVHRVHADGEDFYIAIHPWAVDKLAWALQPELAKREAKLVADIEQLKVRVSASESRAKDMLVTSEYWRKAYHHSNDTFESAPLWKRIKYAITGRLPA